LLWGEWRVLLFLLLFLLLDLLAFNILLFEMGHESVPVLICHIGVLLKFAFNHQLLDTVDGVHILHAFDHDLLDVLQFAELAHCGYCVSLDENVAVRQQLESFESHAVGSDQTLATLDKLVTVADYSTDLYNFGEAFVISQYFDGLLVGN